MWGLEQRLTIKQTVHDPRFTQQNTECLPAFRIRKGMPACVTCWKSDPRKWTQRRTHFISGVMVEGRTNFVWYIIGPSFGYYLINSLYCRFWQNESMDHARPKCTVSNVSEKWIWWKSDEMTYYVSTADVVFHHIGEKSLGSYVTFCPELRMETYYDRRCH